MSLTLSIIALVVALMALPTVFQMFGGGPKITFRFKPSIEERPPIRITVVNERIKRWPLRVLRVRRESASDVHVLITIQESGTGRQVETLRPLEGTADIGPNVAFDCLVVASQNPDGSCVLASRGSLGLGRYVVTIHVVDSSRPHGWYAAGNLTVERDRVYWAGFAKVDRKKRATAHDLA